MYMKVGETSVCVLTRLSLFAESMGVFLQLYFKDNATTAGVACLSAV